MVTGRHFKTVTTVVQPDTFELKYYVIKLKDYVIELKDYVIKNHTDRVINIPFEDDMGHP